MNNSTKGAVERWLAFGCRRHGGQYSETTKGRYSLDIRQFFDFIDKDFRKVRDVDIEKFFTHMKDTEITIMGRKTGKKPMLKSIYHKLTSIRAFFRFAIDHDLYKGKNPMYIQIEGSVIKSTKSFVLSQIISREDVKRIIDEVKSPRDRLILILFANTGMRMNELRQLDLKDIDIENRNITIHGKGDKERMVWGFNDSINNALKLWLMVRKSSKCDALIVGKDGGRLADYYINNLIRRKSIDIGLMKKTSICDDCRLKRKSENEEKYCRKCKWNRSLHAHSLRHCFVRFCRDCGLEWESIAEACGHVSISTSIDYAGIESRNVQKKFRSIG